MLDLNSLKMSHPKSMSYLTPCSLPVQDPVQTRVWVWWAYLYNEHTESLKAKTDFDTFWRCDLLTYTQCILMPKTQRRVTVRIGLRSIAMSQVWWPYLDLMSSWRVRIYTHTNIPTHKRDWPPYPRRDVAASLSDRKKASCGGRWDTKRSYAGFVRIWTEWDELKPICNEITDRPILNL